MKSTTKLSSHELVKSHFVLLVTLSGAKRENFPLLLHRVERIIVTNYFIDGLKSRAIFSIIAPTSFPRYLFFQRPWECGCHWREPIFPRFWKLQIESYSCWFVVLLALSAIG